MQYFDRFEAAFKEKDPIQSLRGYALELSGAGLKRSEVYDIFLNFHQILSDSNREDEENVLGDVMDMISDTYSPFNLNLPK